MFTLLSSLLGITALEAAEACIAIGGVLAAAQPVADAIAAAADDGEED